MRSLVIEGGETLSQQTSTWLVWGEHMQARAEAQMWPSADWAPGRSVGPYVWQNGWHYLLIRFTLFTGLFVLRFIQYLIKLFLYLLRWLMTTAARRQCQLGISQYEWTRAFSRHLPSQLSKQTTTMSPKSFFLTMQMLQKEERAATLAEWFMWEAELQIHSSASYETF